MSNNYVPNETNLLPGELARSADINLRYSNVIAGFDLLPTPLGSGQTGFSAAVNVGTPTADAHAVTKLFAETTIVTAAEVAALAYIQPTLAAHLAATTVLRDEAAASATASANSAAASQTSRLASETAQANAETAETNAETAEASSIAAKNASQASATASATSAAESATSAAEALASENASETSATDSAASAVTSNTAKNAALAAQTAAETAETNAEAAESNVAASASAASASAASALTSKNSATASATSAASSASSASGSAGTATTKANESAASASAALASQNSASTSATTSTNQAATSTTKAGEASASAAAALVSENAAAASESAASTSESNSATSATASANSATSSASSLADFNTKYLGAYANQPSGTAAGQLYFNTTSDIMYVWSGSSWAAAGSAVNGTAERQEYTATSGQTSFSATYDVGFVDVYLNGSKLVPTVDFTASNGSTVVLGVGAATGDNVSIIGYGAFQLTDVYTQSQSNARYTQIANNLSDVTAATARTNLGLVIGTDVEAFDATILKSADIGSTVQAYDATIVVDADIGVTVQGYDANTTTSTNTQTLTNKTVRDTVYALSGLAFDATNGAVQTKTLAANSTFTDSLSSGDAIVLQLEAGASHTVTWPTMTWVTSGGNVAPTLTAKDTLVFWKVSSVLYGAYTGSYV